MNPQLTEIRKTASTREQIMEVLSGDNSLSAKEIHNSLHREYANDSSYQAIHKALIEMESEGILEKENSKYSISLNWIKESKKKLDDMEEKIINRHITDNRTRIINCHTYHDFGRTLLEIFADEVDKGIYRDCCSFHNHMWWIFTLQKDEYYWFKKLGATKCLMACKGNSRIDKFMAAAYQTIGHRVKLGIPFESACDIVVSDDRVYQIYFPEEIKSMVEKARGEVKNSIDAFTKDYPGEMYKEKGTIKIVIIHDRELADRFRKEIKGFFAEKETKEVAE